MKKNIEFNHPTIKGIELKRCSYLEQSSKNHVHKDLSIGYIEKGSSEVNVSGKDYSFTEGEGVIIPPYISHNCKPHNIDYWQFIMMYIDTSYYDGEINKLEIRKLSDFELDKFNELLELISKPHLSFQVENALIELLIICDANSAAANMSVEDKAVEQIYMFIKSSYLNSITLNELQSTYNMNKFSIIRRFKHKYNTTPSAFQLQLKVAYSKKLLANGMNILDACYEAGFYDQAHFTREFKKANGKTPMQYQKDILN